MGVFIIRLVVFCMMFPSLHCESFLHVAKQQKIIYASNGETVVLNCSVSPSGFSTWDGPAEHTLLNTTKYADGNTINNNITNRYKFSIVGSKQHGQYNLQINNVSLSEEGTYRCFEIKNMTTTPPQETWFRLTIKVAPTDITITKSIEDRLTGVENQSLSLVCSVNSGIPPEEITWYNRSSMLGTGGPGHLNITILPQKVNHQEQYMCEVQSDALQKPLRKNVTLDIVYKPDLKFESSSYRIMEGLNMSLICLSDANPSTANMSLKKNQTLLDSKLNSSYLSFTKEFVDRSDGGVYFCKAMNIIGEMTKQLKITVLYPPVIAIQQTFGSNSSSMILECLPSGEPPNYKFHSWEHQSFTGNPIQLLDNTSSITIPTNNFNGGNYIRNGKYICKAENGISDTMGNTVMSGNITVKLEDKPVFVSTNRKRQFGRFNHNSNITVNFYSYPKYNNITVLKDGTDFETKDNFLSKKVKVTDNINNTDIFMDGHEIILHCNRVKEADFTFYEFQITNKHGTAKFMVELVSADKPEKPTQLKVEPLEHSLKVSWKRSFDGGFKQEFFVEFRAMSEHSWNDHGPITDNCTTVCIHILENLKSNTNYIVRVYSNNWIGSSKKTKFITTKTLPKSSVDLSTTMKIVVVGCCLVVSLAIAVFLVVLIKKGKSIKIDFSSHARISMNEIQDTLAVENDIYQSHSNTSNQSQVQNQHTLMNKIWNENQEQSDTHAVENIIYLTQDQSSGYAVGGNAAISLLSENYVGLDNNLQLEDDEPTRGITKGYHKRDTKTSDDIELNYSYVVFSSEGSHYNNCIIGNNEKTIYSDIDMCATVNRIIPKTEQSSNEDSHDEDDDDDFFSMDGLIDYRQSYRRSTFDMFK